MGNIVELDKSDIGHWSGTVLDQRKENLNKKTNRGVALHQVLLKTVQVNYSMNTISFIQGAGDNFTKDTMGSLMSFNDQC